MVINSGFVGAGMHRVFDVGALFLCNWLLFFALKKLKSCGYINDWVVLALTAAYKPVLFLLWVIGICSIYYQLNHYKYGYVTIGNIEKFQYFSIAVLFSWFLFRLKFLIEAKVREKYQTHIMTFDPILVTIFSKISTVLISFFSMMVIFHTVGIPLQTFVLFRGAFSIALGLAAQNILGNFFGYLMIFANRPFRIGDWISSPDKNIEGHVEEIGWNSTRIRTLDRRPLHVPNSIFTHILIMNSSLMYNRHIKQTVGLHYKDVDKIQLITHDIETMLRTHQDIDHNQHIMADWIEFGMHALHIEVYAFTKTIDQQYFRKVQQDICIKVAAIVQRHGAQIAVPNSFVYMENQKEKRH